MRIIAIALLAVPLLAQAQVQRCPDGSYSDRCSDGVTIERGGVSSYEAPKRPANQFNSSGSRSSERHRPSGQAARNNQRVQGARSLRDRARAGGISRNDLVRARSRGTILMGMAEEDVIYILGEPHRVSREMISGIPCKHLHWREGYVWQEYVRICGGAVDHFRERHKP